MEQPQPHQPHTFQVQPVPVATHQQQQPRGVKRPHPAAQQPCSQTVEIQYVTAESKLDAPGKFLICYVNCRSFLKKVLSLAR